MLQKCQRWTQVCLQSTPFVAEPVESPPSSSSLGCGAAALFSLILDRVDLTGVALLGVLTSSLDDSVGTLGGTCTLLRRSFDRVPRACNVKANTYIHPHTHNYDTCTYFMFIKVTM